MEVTWWCEKLRASGMVRPRKKCRLCRKRTSYSTHNVFNVPRMPLTKYYACDVDLDARSATCEPLKEDYCPDNGGTKRCIGVSVYDRHPEESEPVSFRLAVGTNASTVNQNAYQYSSCSLKSISSDDVIPGNGGPFPEPYVDTMNGEFQCQPGVWQDDITVANSEFFDWNFPATKKTFTHDTWRIDWARSGTESSLGWLAHRIDYATFDDGHKKDEPFDANFFPNLLGSTTPPTPPAPTPVPTPPTPTPAPPTWECDHEHDNEESCTSSGSTWTGGENTGTPGCGDCWCCKETSPPSSTESQFFEELQNTICAKGTECGDRIAEIIAEAM